MSIPGNFLNLSSLEPSEEKESEKENTEPEWTNVCPQNLCFDELSSLSSYLSRDLDDMNMSSVEATMRSKLERQNRRKFLAKTCRFNIVLAQVKGNAICPPNHVSMVREKMMNNWICVNKSETPVGDEYIYQVNETSVYFQVSILEAPLGEGLIELCEERLNTYLARKMSIRHGIDECVHVCVCLFPGKTLFDSQPADDCFSEELQLMKRLNDLVSIIPVLTEIELMDPSRIGILRNGLRTLLSKHVKVFDDWFGQGLSNNSIPEEECMQQDSPLIPGPDLKLFGESLVETTAQGGSSSGTGTRNTSEIITIVRSQVLTCPLVVDCTSDFETQDHRYKLPRFDSFPPTSCDFLRMVLIEGCSLILMERTKTLFGNIAERRLRENQRRQKFEQVHGLLVSGVILVAATLSLFKRR